MGVDCKILTSEVVSHEARPLAWAWLASRWRSGDGDGLHLPRLHPLLPDPGPRDGGRGGRGEEGGQPPHQQADQRGHQAREEEAAQHLQDPAAGLRGGGQGGLFLPGHSSGNNSGIFSQHSSSK